MFNNGYDPSNWYWLADDGRLYSSLAGELVDKESEAYHQFIEQGGRATRWPSDLEGVQSFAALDDVLRPYGLRASPIAIEEIQEAAAAEVDAAAETQRLRWITPGAGQAMTYQGKLAEAEACLRDPKEPTEENYPLLSAELGLRAATLREIAQNVVAIYRGWVRLAADIERVRLVAKADIRAAKSPEEIRSILERIVWPET